MTKTTKKKKENIENDNESYINDTEGDDNPTLVVKRVTNLSRAVSRWQDLVTRRRYRAVNNFIGENEAYPTVLEEDLKSSNFNKNYAQEKKNRDLISYFIGLDKSCHENDEVDLDYLETLLSGDVQADINFTDKYGQTVLHEAAREWHPNVASFLINNNANVNATDSYGRTPLHVAAATDYGEMVELLLNAGAYIESLAKGKQTPLHYAAGNDAVKSLKVLLDQGADKEAKDYKLRTPLHLAAELDRSETAKELVERGAKVAVTDITGYKCITHMIIKMAPVAKIALDKFHRKDKRNRKQFYQLSHLEVDDSIYENTKVEFDEKSLSEELELCLAKSPLEAIVEHQQIDLILHPVITRLIDVRWQQFGRRVAWWNLLLNVLYVVIWTVVAVYVPWYIRPQYSFPQDGARIAFLVIGTLFSVYFMITEIMEVLKSRKKFDEWKEWRLLEIKKDIHNCHPKWPDEREYLLGEIKIIQDSVPSYFKDWWNYFDLIVYMLTFLILIVHVIDVLDTNPVPMCCLFGEPSCENGSYTVCLEENAYVNNKSITVWLNRIFVIMIIFMWLRLMKYCRAFRQLGPFIVMLTKMGSDILRFLYLYLEFLIPFSVSFWMIFGGLSFIPTMLRVDRVIVSLYRLTLVDDYQFDEMTSYDVVMGYFLIISFSFLSAILCLNLLIALLSDTFMRVYDNARANAVMQQASLLLSFQDSEKKKRFQRYLKENCNPEEQVYDDDVTDNDQQNLEKVTIQIKDQLDFLMDRLQIDKNFDEEDLNEFDEKTNKLSPVQQQNQDINIYQNFNNLSAKVRGASNKSNTNKDISTSHLERFSANTKKKLNKIHNKVENIKISQKAQEESYKKLRRDISEVKEILNKLILNQDSSINRLNSSILLTRPLTSPAPNFNAAERPPKNDLFTRIRETQHENFIPGAIPSLNDELLTPSIDRLHLAEIKITSGNKSSIKANDENKSDTTSNA